MRRRGTGLAWIILLSIAVAGGCRPTGDGVGPPGEPAAPPSEGMRGISLENFQEGDTRWVLHADTASVFRDRKRVETQAFSVDFFDGERHVSTLTANRGVLMQATDDLEARGRVRVVTDDGAVLRTELLYWDHDRSRIHTDQPVEITRGEDVLTGVGLEADPGLSRVDLQRAVRGTVRSDPETILPDKTESGG